MIKAIEIVHDKLLLVEGKDEVGFFSALLKSIGLDNIQILDVGGVSKFKTNFKTLPVTVGFDQVKTIGIVRDADNNADAAFQQVCDAIRGAGMEPPGKAFVSSGGKPEIRVLIVPPEETSGMLEDVIINSIKEDAYYQCVTSLFECLTTIQGWASNNTAKARVRAYLTQIENIEGCLFIAFQEFFQEKIAEMGKCKQSGAVLHAFLASRPKPTLNVGEAAQAGYWDFEHGSFTQLKEFVKSL